MLHPLDDVPVLGRMAPAEAARRLRDMGDPEMAARVESLSDDRASRQTFGVFGRNEPPAYLNTAHAFGFVAPQDGRDDVEIRQAGAIASADDLRGQRVNLTLSELRIADYPGSGVHHVLFDFAVDNQVGDDSIEHVHFNQVCRGIEGGSIGVIGYPLFLGLRVGSEGLAFRCSTVNVKNENDEALLEFLDGDVFKAGLRLAETAQPAIAPLSSLAVGLTKMVAKRNRNVAVQNFMMGLDFGRTPGGARLAEGLFVAVQIPERDRLVWDWSNWIYKPSAGRIVNRGDQHQLIPYNYISFGVTRHHGR